MARLTDKRAHLLLAGAYIGDVDTRIYLDGADLKFEDAVVGIKSLSDLVAVTNPFDQDLNSTDAVEFSSMILQSATDPAYWGSLIHDDTAFRIRSGTGPIYVGGGAAPGSATGVNDLYASGKFEVRGALYADSISYFDSAIYHSDGERFFFGNSPLTPSAGLGQMMWGIRSTHGRQLIFGPYDHYYRDFLHPVQSTVTTFWHSETNPAVDSTEWGSWTHDSSNFRSGTGKGGIKLVPVDLKVYLGVGGSAPADGDLGSSEVCAWVDETSHLLYFKVKYSDGTTVKSGSMALT